MYQYFILFYAWILFHCGNTVVLEWYNSVIMLTMKKKISSQGHCVGFARSRHVSVGFVRDSSVLPRPRDVHVRLTGISKLSQSEWVYVWAALWWKGVLSWLGSRLVPWAAGIVSSHLRPWSGTSRLENNYITCFYLSFLNVCITHIYCNV